jgi:hypothetical protein
VNWKRIALWSVVAFVWLITFGCWFLSAYIGRDYQDWSRWWAGWTWICLNLFLGAIALVITGTAAVLSESSK